MTTSARWTRRVNVGRQVSSKQKSKCTRWRPSGVTRSSIRGGARVEVSVVDDELASHLYRAVGASCGSMLAAARLRPAIIAMLPCRSHTRCKPAKNPSLREPSAKTRSNNKRARPVGRRPVGEPEAEMRRRPPDGEGGEADQGAKRSVQRHADQSNGGKEENDGADLQELVPISRSAGSGAPATRGCASRAT